MMGRSIVWMVAAHAVLILIWSAHAVEQCPSKIGNCYIMHPADEWHRPIDTDPVDYMSDCHIAYMDSIATGNAPYIKFDIADGSDPSYTIYNTSIPYNVIGSSTPLLPLVFGTDGENYMDESDYLGTVNNPLFPFPQNASIEGWGGTPAKDPVGGDRHILAVNSDTCMLYESWYSVRLSSGFQVANSAIWNMSVANYSRPTGWTSADAAGLPIFPGLLRYDEVASGFISHPLRFTFPTAQYAYTYPGNHVGPKTHNNTRLPVYGSRYRLKASYNESQHSTMGQVIVRAMKQYGIIFADQGSAIYISGVSDTRFSALMQEFNNQIRISINQFEMVQPPKPIVRSYTPTASNMSCNGVSQNSNPNWKPTWQPMAQCLGGSPSPSPSSGSGPSVTPTPSRTPSRTPSVTPSRSPTPSRTPSNSPSRTPSSASSPSSSPPPGASPSSTPNPGASASSTPSRTPSTTPSRTSTPSRTPSNSPSRTPSSSPASQSSSSSSSAPSVAPISPSKSPQQGHKKSSSNDNSQVAIIAGACGGAALVGLAAGGFLVYRRRKNGGRGNDDIGGGENTSSSMVPLTNPSAVTPVSEPVLKPRFPVGSSIMAKFSDGQFYKATVKEFKDGRYLVSYPEYDDQEVRNFTEILIQ